MPTINLKSVGTMVMARTSDSDHDTLVPQSQFLNRIKYYDTGVYSGCIRVIINDVTFWATSFADVLFDGVPATDRADFYAKVAALFPKANTGTGGTGMIYNEMLAGVQNGSNATFETQYAFVPEDVEVFVNGIKQIPIRDYQTIGTGTILFSSSPSALDTLVANYLKQ